MDLGGHVEATVTGEAEDGRFFAASPFLEERERAEVFGCLAALDRRLPDQCRPAAFGDAAGGWHDQAGAALAASSPGLARERWLDLVAELLEASDGALAVGLAVEAFALEGVAGRLLGVLLGDTGPQSADLGGGASLIG